MVVNVADSYSEQAEEEDDGGGVDDWMKGVDARGEIIHNAEVLQWKRDEKSKVKDTFYFGRCCSSTETAQHPNSRPHHEQTVVAERVAGDGGEVVVMAEDAAAVALPPSLASHQAEVPAGGHGVGAARKPPQGDVNGGPQDTQGDAI